MTRHDTQTLKFFCGLIVSHRGVLCDSDEPMESYTPLEWITYQIRRTVEKVEYWSMKANSKE